MRFISNCTGTDLIVSGLQQLGFGGFRFTLSVTVNTFTLLRLEQTRVTSSLQQTSYNVEHTLCCAVITFFALGASALGLRGSDFTAFGLGAVLLPVGEVTVSY